MPCFLEHSFVERTVSIPARVSATCIRCHVFSRSRPQIDGDDSSLAPASFRCHRQRAVSPHSYRTFVRKKTLHAVLFSGLFTADRKGGSHPQVPLPPWQPVEHAPGATARCVGLQRERYNAHAGDTYLPPAA